MPSYPSNRFTFLAKSLRSCRRIWSYLIRPEKFAHAFLIVVVTVTSTFICNNDCHGQFYETFEGETPTWKRHEADCQIAERSWKQRRAADLTLAQETANRAEQIKFRCGPGTKILVSHNVPPSFVITELKPSIRIRSSKRGIRLGVRVVLPHTEAPDRSGPLTTILYGPVSKQTHRWETLELSSNQDLQSQLKEELWMLRGNFGSQVTLRDAFVDRVVLNVYTGAGEHSVEIDDLRLNGIVEANRVSNRVPGSLIYDPAVQKASANLLHPTNSSARPNNVQSTEKRPSHIVRDGTVMLVNKRPFFPRIIEFNGENFDFLKSIGFNTIELKTAPTQQQLQQAANLKLYLISPPPTSVGLSPIGFEFDPVLAWSLGRNLSNRDLPTMQQRISEIRESDQRENRPLVANAKSHFSTIARQADILSVGLQPLGTSFIASQYGDWIKRRSQSIVSAKPVWADIQTELSLSVENQSKALFGTMPPAPIELQQIRFLTAEAISAGARGLRFRSRSRLDQSDPVTRLRALTCQYNNRWLEQIQPWLAGGAVMGQLTSREPGGGEVKTTAINTNRARLLIVQRPTHHEQYWAGDKPLQTIELSDPNSIYTSRAYQLTDVDLKPLSVSRQPSGTQVQIPDCPYLTTIVMTEDPLVVNGLMDSFQQIGQQSMFQMHHEITKQWMAIMQLVDRQMARVGHRTPAGSGSLNEATNALQNSIQMIGRNSPSTALPFLDRTDERLAFLRREIQGEALGLFQSKCSTPLVAHSSLVPLHWMLAGQLQQSASAINGLASGDFENLELMKRSGWENRRDATPNLVTGVELAQDAAYDGQYGLKLSVFSRGTSVVESVPVWVSSPKVNVKPNELIRIHGWVNVPNVIAGSEDGLTIVDSIGGSDLAERIPVTQGWQEFTLYRTAEVDSNLQIKFELNGIGIAMVDEVTVRKIGLSNLRRQATNPSNAAR